MQKTSTRSAHSTRLDVVSDTQHPESSSRRTAEPASASGKLKISGLSCVLAALLGGLAAAPADAVNGPNKFFPTFLVYYGTGPTLVSSDAPKLAKFDLIDIDRYRYQEIGGATWSNIKAYNPAAEIYLYQMGAESANYLDGNNQLSINSLARYNNSRGHPMGTLNGNHPELFLTDSSGNRIYSVGYSNPGAGRYMHLMDFGSSAYQSYWVTATQADLAYQSWRADGVYVDVCVGSAGSGGYNASSWKYPNTSAWSQAMNSFVLAISSGMHSSGQKVWCNKGDTRTTEGRNAWLALDQNANHPDVLLEEGAFAVGWGAAVQFYPEAEWKSQVDLLGQIVNTKIGLLSHTQLTPGQTGTDNWGKPVEFWQTLYYSMASMLLGKNASLNNSYMMFNQGNNFGYGTILRYDEFDLIDLGRPVGNYNISWTSGANIYWREYERGYVAVNPTATDVWSFSFPQPVKQITHSNLYSQGSIPIVSAVQMKGHNAAIVLKSTATTSGGGGTTSGADTSAPTTPSGLTATAVSTSQINLSWAASTDNVGVAGYNLYRNGAYLRRLGTGTSTQDTGLSTETWYSYAVQAVDAAGNVSGQTATVLLKTLASGTTSFSGGDTTAPSTPTNLGASPASSSAMNLSWSASSDNVGVTGYKVYRNGSYLRTIGAVTSWQDTGLSTATWYSYNVQAIDAAGNASGLSNQVLRQTLASGSSSDTTAPSTPTGLTAAPASSYVMNVWWQASSDNVGVAGYRVYRNGVLKATLGNTLSWQDTGLSAATWYSYAVQAYDAAGNVSNVSPTILLKTW